ncbi:MAG: 30S ribosome-binding factor RbfA [Phycisphaerales bacterium]|jgi:ribosome-binding factor A|nr:30S ribosome-binding factor RbfA [Phycisphaerales bacterium]
MSHKLEQLASSIQRGIQDVLARGLHDPRISGLVTVTRVRVLQDYTRAIVGISVLPEERQHLVLKGLQAAAAHIRREVGETVRTREMPRLDFELDLTLKKEAQVLRALSKVEEERRAQDAGHSGDLPSGEASDEAGGTASGEGIAQ